MIIFELAWSVGVRAAGELQKRAPSNRLISRIHRLRPRIAIVVSLLAATACIGLAALGEMAIDCGAASWLQLLVLTALWDGFKFVGLSAVLTVRAAGQSVQWVDGACERSADRTPEQ